MSLTFKVQIEAFKRNLDHFNGETCIVNVRAHYYLSIRGKYMLRRNYL